MRFACLALLTGILGACTMAPDAWIPQTVAQMPEDYGKPDADDATYRPKAWWRGFEDETLNAFVAEALAENLDIAEAAARVERASAQARISRSVLFPSINASAGGSYSDSSLSGSPIGEIAGAGRLQTESYSLSLGASYEVDLFGRVQSDLLARRADARAAEFDFRAVQLAAAAETISTYFEIVDARRQIELAITTADVLSDRVKRTEDRYRRGLVESFELYQVRQDLRTIEASLPQRESALASVQGRLALLLRDYPQDLQERLSGPLRPRLVFDPIPAGLPSELLIQRPDVAAAWERLESARYDIGARRAERFPALNLTGSIGGQGDTISAATDFGTNWTASLAANIVAPIFDAGRISARIAAARATYDERAAAYARSVLNAYREVASAVEDYEEQRQRYRLVLSQLADAEASLDLQARRFNAGVGGYIAYLDAMRAVYQVRANLSGAARDVALSRLGVHRALGGDWSGTTEYTPVEMIRPVNEIGEDAR